MTDPFRQRDVMECDCGKMQDRIMVVFADTPREARICQECSDGLPMQLRVFNGEFVMGEPTVLKFRWATQEEQDARWRLIEEDRQKTLPWNRVLKFFKLLLGES